MRNLFGSFSLAFMYMSASAPDAPPLSDTTIGCFIRLFFCTAACSMRAIWSEAPPAPAATTISTGLVGSHARVGALSARTATEAAPHKRKRVLMLAIFPLLDAPRRRPWWRRWIHVAFCPFVLPIQAQNRRSSEAQDYVVMQRSRTRATCTASRPAPSLIW